MAAFNAINEAMLKRIFEAMKRRGGGSIDLSNEAGIPDAWLDFFAEVFAEADEVENGMAARLLRYLVDGQGEEVLPWLETHQLPRGYLWFNAGSQLGKGKPISESVIGGEITDAGFWIRFGKLMNAGRKRSLSGWNLPGTNWLPLFIEGVQVDHRTLPAFLDVPFLVEMMRREGVATEAALPLFLNDSFRFAGMAGMADYLGKHRDGLIRFLEEKKPTERPYAINALDRLTREHEAYLDFLCDLAVSGSRSVREAALPIVLRSPSSLPLMRGHFENGSASERMHAFEFFLHLEETPEGFREQVEERLEVEKSAKLKEKLQAYLAEQRGANTDGDTTSEFVLGDLPPLPADEPPPESCRASLRGFLESIGELEEARLEHYFQRMGPGQEDSTPAMPIDNRGQYDRQIAFTLLIENRELTLLHFLRLLWEMGWFVEYFRASLAHPVGVKFLFDSAREGVEQMGEARFGEAFELRLLARHVEAMGLEPDLLGREDLFGWSLLVPGLPPARRWAFYAERPTFFEIAFGLRLLPEDLSPWDLPQARQKAFALLREFPAAPRALVPCLLEIALGARKEEMAAARVVLEKQADIDGVILESLGSKRWLERREAARWAADRDLVAAIPSLKKVLPREAHDLAKVAQLDALDRLGESIEPWVSREAMMAEAEKTLARYPADSCQRYLPAGIDLRWKENGEPVPRSVIEWLAVRSVRAKEPESGPLLELYFDRFEPRSRVEFGNGILQRWIGIEDGVTAMKGLLALAAAGADGRSVPLVEAYLRKHYGMRVHQCKALLRVLGWIDDPMAIQLLLSVANRFRTKGIQTEAREVVEALAERRNWTVEELGDRTIPDAGFDTEGVLSLSYGSRTLEAHLDDALKITLHSDEGKALKALPAARKDDDPEAVAEAKRLLSLARKELKTVLRLQKERLYEALCTQRTWRFEDWDHWLNRHPIVGRYCRSLVWIAFPDEEGPGSGTEPTSTITFRPLEDRTLTDVEDREVTLSPDKSIRIAHRCQVDEALAARWVEHFADYEVGFLFAQFSKPMIDFDEKQLEQRSYRDRVGWIVESFRLRSEATGLGYVRGPSEDGGWFYEYRKSFPTLAIAAVIEFSGNFLPEENREVALGELRFERERPANDSGFSGGKARNGIGFSELPRVLLSECVNDLLAIASAGAGFDPDWEKRVSWP